ncbi:hypothetical protein LEMA_P082250.1 [Plenodomus lingam JN3]|uniref:Uncharacterized protein n=1 Tax=Leptosphaeria maculans (strain JN3 / isolate v23.1.3 / race Av1-4-5-6-7-8) TaxID=985895 RepID=E5A5U1_LEPMJ|nr:hypothetical protein LEMA_P082250.1 [Plenodomus lingam JN3]CBX98986.1 hypothetical protein LEMA_P082250.1 [Plenodomus lingam JN3]
MDSLDFPFKIEIDGKAIAPAHGEEEAIVQAALGDNAAIFTLENNQLKSGDWILGRNKSEDRSLWPKKILWFKLGTDSAERAQPAVAIKDGNQYKIKFANASLMAEDDKVFVELMGVVEKIRFSYALTYCRHMAFMTAASLRTSYLRGNM